MIALNLALDPINVPGLITSKLWIKSGSREDPINKKGAFQLLSSLLTRGCGPFSNSAIGDLVEGFGAGLRSDVYEDSLLISLKCADYHAEDLLPLLGWMITSPHLELEHFNLEKELTLQALQRQKESSFNIAFDRWRHLADDNGP